MARVRKVVNEVRRREACDDETGIVEASIIEMLGR